jgi:hypothetical protein
MDAGGLAIDVMPIYISEKFNPPELVEHTHGSCHGHPERSGTTSVAVRQLFLEITRAPDLE